MTQAYSPYTLGRRPAINDHRDLLDRVQHIKVQRDIPREDLRKEIFEADLAPGEQPPTTYDQNRALHLAAGLILLVDLVVLYNAANFVSDGVPPVPWREGVSVDTFVDKYAKLRMKATNDIRRHLVLDTEKKVVWIFHHGTALRHLLSSFENDT
jgi:hypothetical protein